MEDKTPKKKRGRPVKVTKETEFTVTNLKPDDMILERMSCILENS